MLPTRNPVFLSYIKPACAKCEIWRTAAGILIIAGITAALSVSIGYGALKLGEYFQLGYGYALVFELINISSKRAVLIALFSIVLALPGLWLVMRYLHKRPFWTLISSSGKIAWRDYWFTAAVVCVFVIVTTIPVFYAGEATQQIPVLVWLRWILPAIIILMLQTGTEELVFRGYLMQQLAARFHSRAIWLILPAIAFGALHYSPSQFGANAWLVVITAGFIGLILGDITARSGNLSIAMGLHFANNLVVALLIGTPGSLSSLSLFVSAQNLRDEAATRVSMLISLSMIMMVYLIYLLVMRRRR